MNPSFIKSIAPWAIGAAIAIGLILGGYGLYQHGVSVGTDRCELNSQREIAKQTGIAVEKARIEWDSTNKITSNGIQNVEKVKTEIRYLQPKIEKIESPKCTDVGSDFVGVYNGTIRAIKAGANQGSNLPATEVPSSSVTGASGTGDGTPENRSSN